MPQQELDLFEFATGEMTESGACAPEVVRSQLVNTGSLSGLFHDFPNHFWRHSIAPDLAGLIDRPRNPALGDSADQGPAVDCFFDPNGDRNCSDVTSFSM